MWMIKIQNPAIEIWIWIINFNKYLTLLSMVFLRICVYLTKPTSLINFFSYFHFRKYLWFLACAQKLLIRKGKENQTILVNSLIFGIQSNVLKLFFGEAFLMQGFFSEGEFIGILYRYRISAISIYRCRTSKTHIGRALLRSTFCQKIRSTLNIMTKCFNFRRE
jgi:hypothetical protein